MLLNDIGKSPDTTFRKINQHLETNYGFKIAEDVSDRDLVAIMEQIEGEITDLKIRGNDAKASPEISKRLLVLEGIRTLREFAIMQFQSPDLENVINGMCDFVANHFRLSGMHHADFEESVKDAMKHYRSSKYRFPDDLIEQRVRQGAMSKIQAASGASPIDGASVDMESMFEEENESPDEDSEMKGIDIGEDMWGNTPMATRQRDTAQGGHSATAPTTVQGKYAAKVLDNPKLSLAPQDTDNPVPMVRDKNGRMVPDPFAAQKAARQKGIVSEEDVDEKLAVFPSNGGRQMDHMKNGNSQQVAARKQSADAVRADKAAGKARNPNAIGSAALRGTGASVEKKYNASRQADAQRKQFGEGTEMKENLVKNLRRLLETEVSQAEVMMAAKGFAQELQEMVEKIGRLQNEDLPPVVDQMRETYGQESAGAFQTQIYGALQGVMDSLYTAKGQVDDAVSNMASTGQFDAQTDMDVPVDGMDGMDDPTAMDADAGMDADLDNIAGDLDSEDEFGGAAEEEPLGRSMKAESANLKRKVLEMQKLVDKARKLREARA